MTTRVAIGRLEEIIKTKATLAQNKVLIRKKDYIEMDEKGTRIQKEKRRRK